MKLKPTPQKTLPERIEELLAELKTPDDWHSFITMTRAAEDRFIDAKAAEIKESSPGVPEPVIRNMITNRFFGCQCQAVLNVLEQQ